MTGPAARRPSHHRLPQSRADRLPVCWRFPRRSGLPRRALCHDDRAWPSPAHRDSGPAAALRRRDCGAGFRHCAARGQEQVSRERWTSRRSVAWWAPRPLKRRSRLWARLTRPRPGPSAAKTRSLQSRPSIRGRLRWRPCLCHASASAAPKSPSPRRSADGL